ncbi:MAG: AAA family ATPase [Nannocystaceae bacterium]|nr:AAA family ATPase [Myxococcales bacterium]
MAKPDLNSGPLIRLLRLKIDRYRNVAPGTELRFNHGLNVLLGKNGTGKTTLLNLIAACLRGDFSSYRREDFALEYELGTDDWTLTVAIRNHRRPGVSRPLRSRAFSHQVEAHENFATVIVRHCQLSAIYTLYAGTSLSSTELGEEPFEIRLDTSCVEPSFLSDAITTLAGCIERYVDKSLGALERLDEAAVVELFSSAGAREYEKTLTYLDEKYSDDPRGFVRDLNRRGYVEKLASIDTKFEPVLFFTKYMDHLQALAMGLESLIANTCRFDESLEVFRRITYAPDRGPARERGPSCTIVRDEPDAAAEDSGLFRPTVDRALLPKSISHKVLQAATADLDLRELRLDEHDLELLARLVQLFEIERAELRIERLGRQITARGESTSFGHLKFEFTRRDGSVIHHDHLSNGQKRLLTFLYCVAANEHVVIADELVNGLHHGWITTCVRVFGERQAFVTSQNPLLFDYLEFDEVDQVARSFILCRLTREREGSERVERMDWQNLQRRDAETFYTAYKFGNQHIGVLLRTLGLW